MTAAFIWDQGTRIEGLGDPAAEAPIVNRPLSAHQDDALGPPAPTRIQALADIPAAARGYLLLRGHVFVTRRLARRFARAAAASGAPTAQLALEPSVFARSTTALADVGRSGERTLYGLYYRAAPGPPTAEELAAAVAVPLAIREHPVKNDLLERRGFSPEGMDVALTTEAILHVRHWSHLVVANYVALFCRWFDLSPGKLLRYLGAVLRAGWPSRARLLRALTVRGRRCRIHPSAVVEASVLGDEVEIGPCAVVHGSVLGHRVKVDAHANVHFSSLGDASVVSFFTVCNLCVLYPQAMISIIGTQLGVLGRRSTVLGGSLLMDLRDPYLVKEVLVEDGGERVPSGRKLLGPCIGHEAIVAAGVQLAPGVTVPAGTYLVGDPARVIRRVAQADGGALEPGAPHQADEGGVRRVDRPRRR